MDNYAMDIAGKSGTPICQSYLTQAIAINPTMTYVLITISDDEKLLVAEELAHSFLAKISLNLDDLRSIRILGTDLLNSTYRNPLIPSSPEYPILAAGYVTGDSGTGLVHSAPGHGAEDYGLLSKLDILPFSPVDNAGKFTDAVLPESLRGLPVLEEGNEAVVKLLKESGALVHQHIYEHKYPYDWRSKKPVIVRATEQWFANVESIKDAAINAIQDTRMIPESGISNR
jgi:isoleucyl-tRNA synthetase